MKKFSMVAIFFASILGSVNLVQASNSGTNKNASTTAPVLEKRPTQRYPKQSALISTSQYVEHLDARQRAQEVRKQFGRKCAWFHGGRLEKSN
jgi:hypothetical protein